MCVICKQPGNRRPVIIVPISAHSFRHFHPKWRRMVVCMYIRARAVGTCSFDGTALTHRGQTCVADCTHFHLISF